MSREDLSRQLSEKFEMKTPVHQAWLKAQLEKQGYFQSAKKQTTRRRFDFSFMNSKKMLAFGGVVVLVVLGVVLWNPLLQKLGGKPITTYAQEILRLTTEQIKTLSPEQQRILSEQVQGGLEKYWIEAEKSKDLQFLTGKENCLQTVKDLISINDEKDAELYKTCDISEEYSRRALFRFTDSEGVLTHIQLINVDTLNPEEEKIIGGNTVIWVMRFPNASFPTITHDASKSSGLAVPDIEFTTEQKNNFRESLEERLHQYYPDIWQELQGALQVNFMGIEEFRAKEDRLFQPPSPNKIQIIPGDEVPVNEPVPPRPIVIDFTRDVSMDGGVRWYAWVLEYFNKDNQRVAITMKIQANAPYEVVPPLRIFRYK